MANKKYKTFKILLQIWLVSSLVSMLKCKQEKPDLWLACVKLSTQGSQDLADRLTNGLKVNTSSSLIE